MPLDTHPPPTRAAAFHAYEGAADNHALIQGCVVTDVAAF